MINPARSLVRSMAVLPLLSAAALALEIVPVFTDSAGETWDADRQGVVNRAIAEWEALIGDAQTVSVTFDFTNAGTNGYLGRWDGGFSLPLGTDVYPWTPGVSHTVHLNADLFSGDFYTWFDPTPATGGDQPFAAWDALSIARHEIGHILGFTAGFYFDDVGTGSALDKWASRISGTTFDPGGLNVSMHATNNLGHVANAGATAGDLMVTSIPNSVRRDISTTDLDMLALAYGYTLIPEPSTLALLGVGAVLAFAARRRSC